MKQRNRIFSVMVILVLLFSNIIPASAQYEKPTDCAQATFFTKVYYPDKDTSIKIQISFEAQIIETNYQENYHILELTQAEINRLKNDGLLVEVVPNYQGPVAELSIDSIPGYTCYRTVEETFASAAAIAANYPNIAEWIDVGNSWEKSVGQPDGYDMMVLKLTNKSIPGPKPALFITGGIHAREYTTPEMATRFGEYLVQNYGLEPDVTWILDYHEVHLLLQTNPDGRKEAEAGASWRKNTNENYCGVTSTNRGADLNRNFSYQWDCCGGSSDYPCDQTYHGASPTSEPEIQAVEAYMKSIIPDRRGPALSDVAPLDTSGIYIDLHSYGELILWPWGFTSSVPPNGVGMQTLGRKWAYFNGYEPQQAIGLYVTDGASKDFAYGELGIPGYTIEMGTAFFQTCTYFTSTIYPEMLPVLLYAAKAVRTPYVTPAGPDAINLVLSASTVEQGALSTLTASINDTRYSNVNGTEPTQAIAAAEYYVDTPPWVEGATALPMSAADGTFNSTIESVTTVVNTSGWSQGQHTLFVRGKDANNNWGAISAIFLTIEGASNTPPTADPQSVSTAEDTALSITLTGSDIDSDPLTFAVVTPPAYGSLSGTAPDLTYTPAANVNGADSFTFKVNDGEADSPPATISITVTAVNDPPLANPQSVSTAENTPLPITLTGSDIDSASLSYSVTSGPAHGSLSGMAPDLTYTPAAGYAGEDSFAFTVFDGEFTSSPALVSITVTATNDPPTADGKSVSTMEDTAVGVTLSGSDPDGDPLTFAVLTQPAQGVLSGSSPTLTYTPLSDYYGSVSFTYLASDGQLSSSPATVSITISAVNDTPVANAQSLNTQENTPLAIQLSGSDVDGDALSFGVMTGPQHGTLSGEAPALTYTPDNGFNGADEFSFVAYDGAATSQPAVISILVTQVNNLPVVYDQDVSTDEDNALPITLTGMDADGDPLTFGVLSAPTNGSLSGEAPNLVYTPAADYHGVDAFTFYASDWQGSSEPGTIRIIVNPVNDAPTAGAQAVVVNEDASVAVNLSGSDIDGDGLSYTVVTTPAHGSLSGTAPALTYTPSENYNGADGFTFKVNDDTLDSAPAQVSITVNPLNDAPVAIGTLASVNENSSVNITLSGSDIDGDAMTYRVQSGPAHGSLSGTAPVLIYTPDAYYNGADSFTFVANDGQVDSAPATVLITVTDINYLPIVFSQNLSTDEGVDLPITLTGMDPDNDEITFSIVSEPNHGSLFGTPPNLVYSPEAGFTGEDGFTFVANDGQGDSEPGVINIVVRPAGPVTVFWDDFESSQGWTRNPSGTDTATLGLWERANPAATDSSGTKQMDTTASGSYDLVTGPLAGSSAGSYDIDGGVTSIRSPNIVLPAERDLTLSFSYYLAHGTNSSTSDYLRVFLVGLSTQTVFQELGANNDDDAAWAKFSGDISAFAGQTVYILISAADASTASLVEAAVDDVLIMAETPNHAPAAYPQLVATLEDTAVGIVLSGSDVDGDALTYLISSSPSHGTLSGTAPALTYTPSTNYYGSDSFTFLVNDGKANSEPATVIISITAVNDAPVATAESVSTATDTAVSITLDGSDPDGDAVTYTVVTSPAHGNLSGTAPNFTYTPESGYTGADSFTFKVSDGVLESAAAVVSITVTPPGPVTVFWDNFESNLGWIRNPLGTDTATLGLWERADPAATSSSGTKQMGTTVSGTYDLVTGPLAGSTASAYDIDGGITSIRSPNITLPSGLSLTLSFRYYLAHSRTSSTSDYLRVYVVGANSQLVLEELGARNDDDASWASFSGNISAFAGQTVYILIVAADASTDSLVEAAVDDVLIMAQ